MLQRIALCWILVFLTPADSRTSAAITPIAKVLELLNDMVAKGQANKEEEATKFAAFEQWCGDQSTSKNSEINAATEQLEKLNAQIEKADVEILSLADSIHELEQDVGRWERDIQATSAVRSKEKRDYTATAMDYSQSVDAISQAIAVLKKQAYDRSQEGALVQLTKLALVPLKTKQALSAFLQQAQPDVEAMPDDQLFYQAPAANAYEFQSGGILDMLEKLKQQFSQKKNDLDQEELMSQHAYEQILQQLTENIENAKHDVSKKTALRDSTGEFKAGAEGDLAQTTSDRAEDQKYLDDMKAMCSTKTVDFKSRQKLRAEELEAIQKAIEIMSSDAVAGSGKKQLPALLQRRSHSFVQAHASQNSPLQERIAAFLADRARTCNSRLLKMISLRVATDPFSKVKKLIRDLITKLTEEATSETEHKGWCDTELTTNKQTRDARSEDVDALSSDVEELTADIARLTQEMEDLTSAIAELDATRAAATADRMASGQKNEQTLKEAKGAQIAVERAIALLKEFYAESAQATTFAQQAPGNDAPETFSAPYKGMLPEGANVVDFLEVVLSDFSRLEADTATAEADEVEQYKKFMFESEKDKALKENENEHKSQKKVNKEQALHAAQAELDSTREQLDKAIAYYEKLKPTCVGSGVSYEKRVKRREAEIQSLQEALNILTGTDINIS